MLTAVFTWVVAHSGFGGVGVKDNNKGYRRMISVKIRHDEKIRGV